MIDFLKRYPFPLVAILRGITVVEAPRVAKTLFDAGFRLLEVPLNRPGALESIAAICAIAPDDAVIGAGTVLRMEDVDAVRNVGGRLIVSPHCDARVIAHAVESEMLTLPGVVTPTEAFAALGAGAHGLKLFPAEMINPATVKALRSILPPATPLLPVGGINPCNMAGYIAAGADGFGIGGRLYSPGVDPARLEMAAQNFMVARKDILASHK